MIYKINKVPAIILSLILIFAQDSFAMGKIKKIISQIKGNKTSSPAAAPANRAPVINSISPADGSEFLAGSKIEIKVNATDTENDKLQYQFSVGGTIKQTYSNISAYIWQTSGSDTGAVSITCQVKDSQNSPLSKTISYRIINSSVDQVLKKISDNYAKINDFSADMEMSSVLDGKPLGETEYCRYYSKAPDTINKTLKEKTETFSDSQRTHKTESIIINDYMMYVLDGEDKLVQEVNMLDEAGINAGQFNQMDILYNQDKFLSSHRLSKNSSKTDYAKKIIVLTALPKQTNAVYAKLELYIDYDKGILTKSNLYKKNEDNGKIELLQVIETTDAQQMTNGAWAPVKMKKTPTLTAGKLVSELVYSNIQINTGLNDSEFEVKE